jgi:hypothetical protein
MDDRVQNSLEIRIDFVFFKKNKTFWEPGNSDILVFLHYMLRLCLGTKFLKTTVFEILYYTLVMTIP